MCLTNTTDLIDFDQLDPKQKKKIDELKRKLKDRKKAHQKMIDDIDRGLKRLEKKTGG